jgi:hypothetical protein
VPRDFFRLQDEENYDAVFDRSLLFLEKLFIAVKHKVEKLPRQENTSLPLLLYDHLGDRNTRQKFMRRLSKRRRRVTIR